MAIPGIDERALVAGARRWQRDDLFAALGATVLLAVFVASATTRQLSVPDEGRYLDIARWMVISGDWTVPRLNGLPFQHKPPLFFWIEAAALKMFGATLFAGRLASMLGAGLALLSVYWLGRIYATPEVGCWSAVVLATSPIFFAGAQYANLDMLVAGLITATIALAAKAVQANDQVALRWWIAAYAMAALALLAKGLIGIAIPGLVFVVWCVIEQQPRHFVTALPLSGIAIFAVIAGPWLYFVELSLPGFLKTLLVHHHFERYTQTVFNNRIGPWFFPAVLIAGTVPWIGALVGHAIMGLRTWSVQRGNWFAAMTPASLLCRLALVWLLCVVVFFSIPASKLAGYIFPALPPLALIIGTAVAGRPIRRLLAAGAGLACMAVTLLGPAMQKATPDRIVAPVAKQFRSADRVVFLGRYFHSVAFLLNRKHAIPVVGNWEEHAAGLPDNEHRELIEGAEAMRLAARDVLIDAKRFAAIIAAPGVTWIVAEAANAESLGLQNLPTVARDNKFVVMRVVGQ